MRKEDKQRKRTRKEKKLNRWEMSHHLLEPCQQKPCVEWLLDCSEDSAHANETKSFVVRNTYCNLTW